MTLHSRLEEVKAKGTIPENVLKFYMQLYESYAASLTSQGISFKPYEPLFVTLLEKVEEQCVQPYDFQPYHHRILKPFDYYQFGVDFIRPLVDFEKSFIKNTSNVDRIDAQIKKGDNVILFANHQTEVDPQLMSIILEKKYPFLAQEVIFVAGDRVVTDPLAIPFSMGRNLLCIYSKRHIENPPEKKLEKQLHNQRTMKRMKELLSEGGKFIYVAPSGGRDRLNAQGEIEVAPFDPPSIEMFRLMATQADHPTHFYPLALVTYDILPPPQTIGKELGETRNAKREGAMFAFGDELDMENYPGKELTDRQARRAALAEHIWNFVNNDHEEMVKKQKNN